VAQDKPDAIGDLNLLLTQLGKGGAGVSPHQEVAGDLTKALHSANGQQRGGEKTADGWVDLDLVGALAAAPPAAPAPPRQRWWRAALDTLPPVLVFVPILLTWLSLFAASNAYRGLENNAHVRAANAGKSFLELWQQGFAGRLSPLLSFGNVAIYTVSAVALLIITTAAGTYFRRRDETEADDAHAAAERARHRLLPAMVRAQAELNRRRLGTPARFATELSQAASGLRELLADTTRAQASAVALAEQNQLLAVKLGGHVTEMEQATGNLRSAAEVVGTAALALSEASAALGTDITGRVDASVDRLDKATDQATVRVEDLVQVGQGSLDGITGRFDAAMDGVRSQIDATGAAMIAAGERYATAIGESSGKAATEINEICQDAVATATVKLVSEMATATAKLEVILSRLSRNADTQLDAARRNEQAVAAHGDAVTAAADSMSRMANLLEQTVTDCTSIQRELANSLGVIASNLARQASAATDRLAVEPIAEPYGPGGPGAYETPMDPSDAEEHS
jgi:hypothetical protein